MKIKICEKLQSRLTITLRRKGCILIISHLDPRPCGHSVYQEMSNKDISPWLLVSSGDRREVFAQRIGLAVHLKNAARFLCTA